MYCSHCGTKLNTDARFCSSCGSPIDQTDTSIPSQNADRTTYTIPGKDPASTSYNNQRSSPTRTSKPKKKRGCLTAFLIIIAVFFGLVILGAIVSTFETDDDTTVIVSESFEDVDAFEENIPETPPQDWQAQFSTSLVDEIRNAFSEIGENPDNIISIEYYNIRETDLFDRREYIVEFSDTRETVLEVFDEEKIGWVHNDSYLITTEEWHEGEPEREQYPEEYLVSISFWNGEDLPTNIDQWTHTGWGVLQNASATEQSSAIDKDVSDSDTLGTSRSNPIVISTEDLVSEIDADIDAAKEKYNNNWVEITGTITYISESAGMTGYYVYGERGGSGLNITCWVYDENAVNLSVGDTATFIGALREITTFNNTEIGDCIIK